MAIYNVHYVSSMVMPVGTILNIIQRFCPNLGRNTSIADTVTKERPVRS